MRTGRVWIASRSSSAVKRRATNAAPSHRDQICDQRSIASPSSWAHLDSQILRARGLVPWRLLSPFSS